MPPGERISVTLMFAAAAYAISRQFSLAQGSTIEDVLALALADPEFAGIDLAHVPVGIFGRVVQRNRPLQEGDRVELYRPLAEDPKTARRQRARVARKNQ